MRESYTHGPAIVPERSEGTTVQIIHRPVAVRARSGASRAMRACAFTEHSEPCTLFKPEKV